MKKRVRATIIVTVLLLTLSVLVFAACSGSSDSEQIYYRLDGAELDEYTWIKISGTSWSDDMGDYGYAEKYGDSQIRLTSSEDGDSLEGVLNSGILYLTSSYGEMFSSARVYMTQDAYRSLYSGEVDPIEVGETKTLSLYDYDGTVTTISKTVGMPLGELPTPTRVNYAFAGWQDANGTNYTSSSKMPSSDLALYATWTRATSTYRDSFVSLGATGEVDRSEVLTGSTSSLPKADSYLRMEITSDLLTAGVGSSSNFSVRDLQGLSFSVASGYSVSWYQGNFGALNGAQVFTVNYGNNVQLFTISDASGVVRKTYLLNIYLKRDYTVYLYRSRQATNYYDSIVVSEGDSLPLSLQPVSDGSFEFDKWVYYTGSSYRTYSLSTAVTSNLSLYQTYKPYAASKSLDGGTLSGSLKVTPYLTNQTLAVPTKANYDFLGWKANGSYFTDNQGRTSGNYYSSSTSTLTASWAKKKVYYIFSDDVAKMGPAVLAESFNGSSISTSYSVTLDGSSFSVDSSSSRLGEVGSRVSFSTATKPGYTFLGWYSGSTKLSEDLYYEFSLAYENKSYTASWTYYTVTTTGALVREGDVIDHAVLSFDLNGGTDNRPASQTITASNPMVYPTTIPTRSGYVFAGWYTTSSCETLFDFTQDLEADVTVYAKWISYSGAGVLPLNGTISSITVSSSTSSMPYYAFVPLASGTITLYSSGSGDSYGCLYNSSKSLLTSNDDAGSGRNFSITYSVTAGTLYYLAGRGLSNTITLSLHMSGATYPAAGGSSNGFGAEAAGTYSYLNNEKVTVGEEVTLTAETDEGYTFLGWYEGEELVTAELTHTFTMEAENKSFLAKWTYYTVTTESENPEAGSITEYSEQKVTVGESVTVTAEVYDGYAFLGWYDGNDLVSDEASYTFTMGSANVILTAHFDYVE